MNLSKRKAFLEKELKEINQRMKTCNHEYGETHCETERVKVPYGSQTVAHGIDRFQMPEGYRDEERVRWCRTCKKCGHKIYSDYL